MFLFVCLFLTQFYKVHVSMWLRLFVVRVH